VTEARRQHSGTENILLLAKAAPDLRAGIQLCGRVMGDIVDGSTANPASSFLYDAFYGHAFVLIPALLLSLLVLFRHIAYPEFVRRILFNVGTFLLDQAENEFGSTSPARVVEDISHTLFSFFSQSIPGKPTRNGVCGLVNLGNTCYMNATIQCLNTIPAFRELLLKKTYTINPQSALGSGGVIVKEFGTLLERLWSNQFQAFAPVAFRNSFGNFKPDFAGSHQQDAHDFLVHLIQVLHEDMNCGAKLGPYRARGESFDHMSSTQRSKRTWLEYQQNNQSPLMDLFLGQARSTIKCDSCGHENGVFDMLWQLSLELPPSSIFVNIKVFPNSPEAAADSIEKEEWSPELPVIFGVWVSKNPTMQELTDHVSNMIAETYGREDSKSSIIFTTVAQDGTQAIANVCKHSEFFSILSGGELIYAFEVSGGEVEDDGDFLPFVHRVMGDSQTFEVHGLPSLVFVRHTDVVGDLLKSVQKESLKSLSVGRSGHAPLFEEGTVRVVSTTALLQSQGKDLGDLNISDIVEHLLPGRVTLVLDVHEDSDLDRCSPLPLVCHPTFNNRPSVEMSQSVINLEQCLMHYTHEEAFPDYVCTKCGGVKHRKQIQIERAPNTLIIHLKRFEDVFSKLVTKVDFGVELDLGPFMVESAEECVYTLTGIVLHVGGLGSGHYTSLIRQGKCWFEMNDEKVTCIPFERTMEPNLGLDTSSVYILFFEKMLSENATI